MYKHVQRHVWWVSVSDKPPMRTSFWVLQGRGGAGTPVQRTFPAFFRVKVNILPEILSTMY